MQKVSMAISALQANKRRASMADAMQRYTVKTTADSIMDDMADAFGDWDFGPDEIDEPDANDYMQSDESTSNDHLTKELEVSRDIIPSEVNKESWEALVDPNSIECIITIVTLVKQSGTLQLARIRCSKGSKQW